jgi:hypothetical protein
MDYTAQQLSQLHSISALVSKEPHLCNFMRKCEREVMVSQTIRASVHNLESVGHPCSVRGKGVFSYGGNGLVDNRSAYGWLLSEGYFVEGPKPDEITAEGDTVIYATPKLLDALDAYFTTGTPAVR